MANVFTVISGNGGMGKSFFACNLACGLKISGKKVLLAECSFGTGADDVILGIKSETLYDMKDVCEGSCDASEAIIHPDDEILPDFIPSGFSDVKADFDIAFKKLKKKFSSYYDYIIFDTPYFISPQTESAVKISDAVIALTDDSFISVRNTSLCVNRAKSLGSAVVYTVLSNVVIDGNESSGFVEDIIDETGAKLLGIIPHDEYVSETISGSTPIIKYNTFAGRAMENICKRLLGKNVPEFETGVTGLFNKNKLVLK